MSGLLTSKAKVLCAFCKLAHRVYKRKDLTFFDVSLFFIVTSILTWTIWGELDLRGSILFMVFMLSAQIFVRMRWRESVKCDHCGFDPVVYGRSPEVAAAQVKTFLEARKDNPKYLLKPVPNLPTIIKEKEKYPSLVKKSYLQLRQEAVLKQEKVSEQLSEKLEEVLLEPQDETPGRKPKTGRMVNKTL